MGFVPTATSKRFRHLLSEGEGKTVKMAWSKGDCQIMCWSFSCIVWKLLADFGRCLSVSFLSISHTGG